jgi:hypothetical protein
LLVLRTVRQGSEIGYAVKPVLRGHPLRLGTKKNWPYKTGGMLKEVKFI